MCSLNSHSMVQLAGHLRAEGIKVQRTRIRASLRRVDPDGVLHRGSVARVTRRRQYSCAGPNHVWHIDGHHKLIRYG